ncbi:MAG: SIMPL domain-containing protein [Candidatus Paceibacterota bacterium]|jgi:hypothetical protein|nr:SIMPL domain-containing protein [Candidatus Paceibacterota bacterium]MDD4830853.1 SIMPL domain-containing protein [Candidatus Paceibacterota bacterium]MDD4875086.1 SIMPL domain-containing protein [Candidatus Paceibacterota bacterium]
MDQEIRTKEFKEKIFLAVVWIAGIFLAIQAANFLIDYEKLSQSNMREITVSASGQAFVIPDIALVRLGVTTEGFDIAAITSDNNEKMNKIIGEIKAIGVEEKDIQTTNYSLSPKYDYSRGSRIFKGYTLIQQITVKAREFEKIGDILNKASNNGANLIGDFQFTIEDENSAKQSARADAIQKAKAQAESIAEQSGLKLGKIVNVYEGGYPSSYDYSAKSSAEVLGMGGGTAADIEPGQQEISVSINLVYEIR